MSEFIDEIDQLNQKISNLQTLLVNMKVEFDLITKKNIEKEDKSEPTSEIEVSFLRKSLTRILKIYMKKGKTKAHELLDSYENYIINYCKNESCIDDERCVNEVQDVFTSIRDFINVSEKKTTIYKEALKQKIENHDYLEDGEEQYSKLLHPLSNELRLKILKTLSNGGRYYAQLERQLGLKGGHFFFHLNKLIDVGYVSYDKDKNLYEITINGLQALKYLSQFKKSLVEDTK